MEVKEFRERFVNKIIHGKDLDVLRQMPDECVDVCVTSPPYNLRNTNPKGDSSKLNKSDKPSDWWKTGSLIHDGYEGYEDNLPHDVYVEWQRNLIKEVLRTLKPNGALFYNHKWRVMDGLLQTREDIVSGFPVRQIIIWDRYSGMTYSQNFFMPVYEVVYLICKPEFKLLEKGPSLSDIWRLSCEKNNPHPAPFPLEFVEKCVTSCVEKNSNKIILDPYSGSATTAIFAEHHGCRYIGIEQSETYIKDSLVRMEKNRLHFEMKRDEKGREFKYFDNKQEAVKVKKITDML